MVGKGGGKITNKSARAPSGLGVPLSVEVLLYLDHNTGCDISAQNVLIVMVDRLNSLFESHSICQ